MIDPDKTLINTTKTHRDRLASAIAYGDGYRRPVNTNLKRFIGSVVLAAVAGVGCLGYSFVVNLLAEQRQEQAVAAYREALSASPIQPGNGFREDEETGYLVNPQTGVTIDPRTGWEINEETGMATDPQGRTVDPRTNWYVDLETGHYTDPETGVTIDPDTQQVVEEEAEE
ncbi:hypothetical protein [Georgenia alba]|uniref:OCRE domain-containing protein n=1 Tax=Georgenia alba TaxID=2233858 RepID=A0ABW2Q9A4_9MICO